MDRSNDRKDSINTKQKVSYTAAFFFSSIDQTNNSCDRTRVINAQIKGIRTSIKYCNSLTTCSADERERGFLVPWSRKESTGDRWRTGRNHAWSIDPVLRKRLFVTRLWCNSDVLQYKKSVARRILTLVAGKRETLTRWGHCACQTKDASWVSLSDPSPCLFQLL